MGDREPCWTLGFAVPPLTAHHLLRHQFRSKIGGRPAWLDPVRLPSQQQLACDASGQPLDFLLQVYAPPPEELEHAFHRSLLLFSTPEGQHLQQPGAVKAFRCQLPLENAHYSTIAPTDGNLLPQPAWPASDGVSRDRSALHCFT